MFFIKRRVVHRRVIHPDKARIVFKAGQTISLMGRQFTISVQETTAKYSTARINGDMLTIRLTSGLTQKEIESHISKLARRALARALLPQITTKINDLNVKHFSSTLGKARLKDNLSNWGSCSVGNNINLDFRLLFGPMEILDAVILHELAHTRHRNHSQEYHSTVLAIMPDNRERLKWLRENGQLLTSEAAGTLTYPQLAIQEIKETPQN